MKSPTEETEAEQPVAAKSPPWHVRRQAEPKISRLWRPAMGWMYMAVCIFDFIIFPAAWSLHLGYVHQPITEWQPLTLQGAGFFHIAMGAVLGVAVWNRTVEKLADKV